MNINIQNAQAETFHLVKREVLQGRVSEKECRDIADSYLSLAREAKYIREKNDAKTHKAQGKVLSM